MSWLYSIVFASLFVSSDLQIEPQPKYININTPAAALAAVKDETEKIDQSYPLSANGRVSVSNVNGSIEMIAWDRNEVRLEATKIADSRESLDLIELLENMRKFFRRYTYSIVFNDQFNTSAKAAIGNNRLFRTNSESDRSRVGGKFEGI